MFINDPYLSEDTVIDRLINEYHKYKNLIIAFDFDGTVYDFHNQGFKFPEVIKTLQECKKLGFYLYVFTANPNEEFVATFLKENNIPYDAINDSPVKANMNNKKPYYNILLDDRAGLSSSLFQLKQVISKIKNNELV